jgi:phosphatidylethanolamine/phosphatidyl-N-methylethanolamine N-methyltransferase
MSISKIILRSPVDFFARLSLKRITTTMAHRTRYKDTVQDGLLFFKAWRENPTHIGAVLPSGPALSAAITREIGPAQAPVLELGCGTGVFTRKMIERGLPAKELTLVELDPVFASRLQFSFPQAQILCIDASKLYKVQISGGGKIGAAICGLPLLNMSTKKQFGILRGVFSTLRPDGALYLFSYGLHCPVPLRLLDRLGLRARKLDTVLLNVPPARIWKLTRRASTGLNDGRGTELESGMAK